MLTFALVDGARRGGCTVCTHTRVTGFDVESGRVRGVSTDRGHLECEVVVNAGGMYAAEIGALAGVRVPIVPMAHEYLVTQPFREVATAARAWHLPTHARSRQPDLLP